VKLETSAALVAFACALSCSTRYAETAKPGPEAGSGGAPACTRSFAERFSYVTVTLSEDIRAKAPAYDWLPRDERLALSIGKDQKPSVAWLNGAGDTVHVSSFDNDGTFLRPDVTLPSSEVGGLIAESDGFALLTSGPDPGEALQDPNQGNTVPNRAALLSRYRNGELAFKVPLTGTAQITSLTGDDRRDCTPMPLAGRLADNGARYGAYFAVHGCAGHPHASYYSDKLAYVSNSGAHVEGGFEWVCSDTAGLSLLPESSAFTASCFSDGEPAPGLNLIFESSFAQLSPEAHASGYVGGQFGAMVKMSDGSYVVGWTSRGTVDADARVAARDNPDLAFMVLAPDYSVRTAKTWLSDTPEIAEYNLHVAPYGPNRVLFIWDSVLVNLRRGETGFGQFQGTFTQLFDIDGNALGAPEQLNAPGNASPNHGDDIAVYKNGDLGWAWVDAPRDYQEQLRPEAVSSLPAVRTLKIARLKYCE
jgi:hypothetical protein